MTEILTRRETGPGVGPLRNLLDGDAVAPGDAEWDEARARFAAIVTGRSLEVSA